eukprot:4959032-Amphidinium_carterae.1
MVFPFLIRVFFGCCLRHTPEERIMKEIVATRERLAARLDATKQLVCELQESRKKLDAVQSQQAGVKY